MDSKLKRITIFTVIVVMVCVIATVVLVNDKSAAGGKNKSQVTQDVTQDETALKSEEDLSAFMLDETFFDKEPNKYAAMQSEAGKKAFDLMVTSVEKDLRVKVVDATGLPVVGEAFYIVVEGNGEYKDLDQDGVVYIGGLQAGEYYVSLKATDGDEVPSTRVKVSVKDKVEYKVINDISYLMKTEDQVDAKIEDTEENGAKADADGTENTAPVLAEESEFGIDVSKYNKEIDWHKVKAAGVSFAIIRCGYRGSSSGSLVEDPYFAKNIEGATEAGVKVGLYFFTQATTQVEAVEEASMAITLCNKYQLDYPIFIDTEGAGGNGRADALDRTTRTQVCKAFCETVQSAGYSAGVYASKNWYQNNLSVSELEPHAIWLAEYKEAPTYGGTFHLWQYTSNGTIDGIEGRVDLNISLLR